jgi:predicted  nucleic acid-binding Zn-ribbon protein
MKDSQIDSLERNLENSNSLLDFARAEAADLQARCVELEQHVSAALKEQSVLQEDLDSLMRSKQAEVCTATPCHCHHCNCGKRY